MPHRVDIYLAACMALVATPATAQRGSEARIILTIDAGVTASQPTLWVIARQPLLVPGTEGDPQPRYDTVSLARAFTTNILLGVAGAYYLKPFVGIELSVTWLGLTTETSCVGVAFDSLLGAANRDMCTAVQGTNRSLGAIAFSGGGVLRGSPRSAISPYARVAVGLISYSVSTTYVEAPTLNGIKIIVGDPRPRRLSIGYTVGVGTTVALGPGYQFRLDLADVAAGFEHLTGPADPFARAPRGTRLTHHLTFTMGLGIVLESKRGRRY